MKTHKIMLLITAAFIVILLVSALFVMRSDIQTLVAEVDKELKYQSAQVSAFHSVNIPSGWNVKIRQGRLHKIDIAVKGNSALQPEVEISAGEVNFLIDTLQTGSTTVYARITMPYVEMISTGTLAHIRMDNFTSDSIRLELADGSVFQGKNNSFKYVNYQTSGKVSIETNNIVAN